MYEITYSWDSGNYAGCMTYLEAETFIGTWSELQAYIKQMKRNGCYHIEATYIPTDEEIEEGYYEN